MMRRMMVRKVMMMKPSPKPQKNQPSRMCVEKQRSSEASMALPSLWQQLQHTACFSGISVPPCDELQGQWRQWHPLTRPIAAGGPQERILPMASQLTRALSWMGRDYCASLWNLQTDSEELLNLGQIYTYILKLLFVNSYIFSFKYIVYK